MDNPLLRPGGLPAFAAIRAEHVTPALDVLLPLAERGLERATADDLPADYDALSAELDVPVERLGRAWGAVRT